MLILHNQGASSLINQVNADGISALHLAAKNGLVKVVKLLILRKADVLAVDKNGKYTKKKTIYDYCSRLHV